MQIDSPSPAATAPAVDAISWPRHVRATAALAVPLVGAQLGQMAMGVTDTVMIGWLGAADLAASVLATQAMFLLFIFGAGFAQAVLPIAASAAGLDDLRGLRRSVRMGLWILMLYGSITLLPLWYIEPILLGLGQEPDLARRAGLYMHVAQWSILPALMVMGLRSYLTVVERAWLALAVIAFGAVCNALLNWAFIFGNFGAPRLGIVGAALATTLANLLMAALLVGYTLAAPALRHHELWVRLWRPDWDAFRMILRLGWPIGATIIAEVGLFATSSVMMGWIGTVPLAAHGIALQIASIAFMIPLGIASAATVRVGVAYGRGDRTDLGRAGVAALAIAALIAVSSAALFWTWPHQLISLYLDDASETAATVLAYGVPLLLVAAAFQIFDSLQVVASGILRGLQDTRVPMLIAIFSYWIVGLPTALLLAFVVGLGGTGVWWGLAFGLGTAATLLTARFFLRDRFDLLDPRLSPEKT